MTPTEIANSNSRGAATLDGSVFPCPSETFCSKQDRQTPSQQPERTQPPLCIPGTHRSCHLSTQANAMAAAYAQSFLLSDMHRTIRLAEEAAAATPEDHPHRALHIARLAAYWSKFYSRTGAVEHLDTAIGYWRDAVGAAEEGDPQRGVYSWGLAVCVRRKVEEQ